MIILRQIMGSKICPDGNGTPVSQSLAMSYKEPMVKILQT